MEEEIMYPGIFAAFLTRVSGGLIARPHEPSLEEYTLLDSATQRISKLGATTIVSEPIHARTYPGFF